MNADTWKIAGDQKFVEFDSTGYGLDENYDLMVVILESSPVRPLQNIPG